jgi:DNA ligase (NAD+)
MNKVEYFQPPLVCPACGSGTKRDGVYLICPNPECSGGKIGDLIKWTKKLDLKGVASATLEKLYDAQLVASPADLYKLKPELICELEGFGSSSANKIVDTMNSKKEVTFPEFISGLNIPNFSESTAELLEKNGVDSVEKLQKANVNDLVSIKGIGETTANDIIVGISKKEDVILQLFNVGITIKEKKEKKPMGKTSKKLSGSFCFTGAIQAIDSNGERMTRDKMWELVELNGGTIAESVTKDTNYLVTADIASTSSKVQKARKFGVNIISEVEFFGMVG